MKFNTYNLCICEINNVYNVEHTILFYALMHNEVILLFDKMGSVAIRLNSFCIGNLNIYINYLRYE